MNERKALIERLKAAQSMIGKMCSEGRPPAMSIPARPDVDEDLLISATLRDAIAALSAEPSPDAAQELLDAIAPAVLDLDSDAVDADLQAMREDAAQGGEQGEVPCELIAKWWAHASMNVSGRDGITWLVNQAIAWDRQNRAPHPSQAGAEAVDEGMVRVPRELVLRARNELQRLMACIESNEEAAYVEGVADDLQSALSITKA